MRISDWSSDVCSSDLVVSTNPIAIAVPAAGRPPLILDLATSVASLGKILAATPAGQSIPEDWGLDSEGPPTTAPAAAKTLMPMSGAKASGLSPMTEILASLAYGNAVLVPALAGAQDRKSVVLGKREAVRAAPARRRAIKKI